MARVGTVPGALQVPFDGNESHGVQWDAPEPVALSDHVNDGLVTVGIEIPNFESADFDFS